MAGPLIGGDEVNAIVLDIGTYQVKAGYAGEDAPKFVFPSAVGQIGSTANGADRMEVDGAGGSGRRLFVGSHALAFRRDHMEVSSPFTDGILTDWEAVEGLCDHVVRDQMRLDTAVHPMMIAEASHNSMQAREKMVELMFEKYDAPAVFVAKNAVLSSFAMGRQTSLVVDCGHESTVVSAVHDGYVLNKSVVRSPLAGRLLTRCMLQAVEARGASVRPRYAFRRMETAPGVFRVEQLDLPATTASYRAFQVEAIAQDIKHSICRVSDNPFDPEANASIPTVSYELPDGQEIQIGAARFAVPEVLFNPPLLSAFGAAGAAAAAAAPGGLDSLQGLQALVPDCINRCDVDVRRELYGGVLLTGGTALFSSLRDRLERELTDVAPQMAKVKVVSPINTVERRYSVWIGGSILASLGTFQQMWMSKAEYREHGAGLIHKKAP